MKINFENITESSQWFNANLFSPYYRGLGTVHQTAYLRLASPVIGILDGLISSLQAVSGLSEAILKGTANTAHGIATADRRVLKKGVLQIALGGGSIALLSVPIIALRTLRITFNMARNPSEEICEQRQKLFSLSQKLYQNPLRGQNSMIAKPVPFFAN